ncbi:Oxoglutarate/iron-dependent dioxygenase [Artemisia annua]|uniref:procollagen-proline 4-dioxygenase n=1 Tax=Artemisia annua TaxID=35608 RepID=A0A2U1P7D6_ARTAN|nr:Oxoglutarate/iron-dependent dioxygenase [Artemisia annua]
MSGAMVWSSYTTGDALTIICSFFLLALGILSILYKSSNSPKANDPSSTVHRTVDRSDVEKGGETVFPSAKPNISVVPGWNELSKSGKKGLFVKPTMGDPLLFWSMKPDGSVDPLSLHASLTSSANSTLIPSILIIGSSVLLTLGILLIPKSLSNLLKAHYRTTVDREDQSVEVLSSEPRAVIFHNFLSPEECDYLISLAKPHMSRSTVNDRVTGKSIYSSTRTSSSMYLARERGKMIQSIEKRIADITSLPVENGEGLSIIHYEVGQKIENHHDYFTNDFMIKNGGQRLATVLMYLSDVEEGGETVFPSAKGNINRKWGKKGLSVKPKKGDALLFYSMKPDASLDPLSLHGGRPVIKGDKWCAVKWIRVNKYKV